MVASAQPVAGRHQYAALEWSLAIGDFFHAMAAIA